MRISGIDILSSLLGLLLMAGCSIKEDFSDCPDNDPYELFFVYTGDGTTDIFNSKIETVQLYVFDTGGSYIDSYSLTETQLHGFQGIRPMLRPGPYDIVCWGNRTELSTITGDGSSIGDHFLYNTEYLTGMPVTGFDSLYYGRQRIEIPESGGRDTVRFSSAHVDMEIIVEGLDPGAQLIIRNVAVGYDFRREFTGGEDDMYPVLTAGGENRLVSRFDLFRFRDDNDILIEVYNGDGKLVYILDLAAFMLANDLHVEGINEASLSITISFRDTWVHVSVTGWEWGIVDPVI